MGCNWGKLLAQDRVKAIGTPWTPEEANAIYNLKIPADFVRNGCLTLKDYKEASKKLDDLQSQGEEKPLIYLTKKELQVKAGVLGIQFTPEETTRADLIHLISIELAKLPAEQPEGEVGSDTGELS